jgi:hypothetical protein
MTTASIRGSGSTSEPRLARYDSQRLVDLFAESLRSEVDLPAIRDGMFATAATAVRPAHGAVWQRGGGA